MTDYNFFIRPVEVTDEGLLYEWKSDSFTRQMIPGLVHLTASEHLHLFEEQLKKSQENQLLVSYSENKNGPQQVSPLGVVDFQPIIPQEAELIFFLNPHLRNRKLAEPMLNAALKYAYNKLGILSVFAFVLNTNQQSIHLMHKLNFELIDDGEYKKSFLKDFKPSQ